MLNQLRKKICYGSRKTKRSFAQSKIRNPAEKKEAANEFKNKFSKLQFSVDRFKYNKSRFIFYTGLESYEVLVIF